MKVATCLKQKCNSHVREGRAEGVHARQGGFSEGSGEDWNRKIARIVFNETSTKNNQIY